MRVAAGNDADLLAVAGLCKTSWLGSTRWTRPRRFWGT